MGYSKMFNIFFLFLIFTTFAPTTSLNRSHKCSEKDSEALLLFKQNLSSINYPNDVCSSHPKMMSWNTSTDCCKWDGVYCDESTGDVIDLDLECGMLQGTIHPDSSLSNLTHLTYLHLSGNNLNGTLPSWLFTSPSLESLDLQYNMLSGKVPSDISINLTHLTSLDLSHNKLNGTLPSWLFTSPSLESLALGVNMFSGNVPFESFALPSLKYLDLRNNQLGGQIDVQTIRQLTNVTHLYLSYNNFSGELELDTLLSNLTNLESLYLSYI